jgi:hypothetical protein
MQLAFDLTRSWHLRGGSRARPASGKRFRAIRPGARVGQTVPAPGAARDPTPLNTRPLRARKQRRVGECTRVEANDASKIESDGAGSADPRVGHPCARPS